MKPLPFILSALVATGLAYAQSTTPETASHKATQIYSDTGEFNPKTRIAIYRGNVHVDDSEIKLTCDLLTARTPEEGKRIESVVAEGNVVMDMTDEKGQTNHATSGKMVYTYKIENGVTNEFVVLTENPRIDSPGDITTTAEESVTWNRLTGTITTVRGRTISKNGFPSAATPAPAPAPVAAPAPITTPATNQ